MRTSKQSHAPNIRQEMMTIPLTCGLLLIASTPGCVDHRMSLADFIAIEQQQQQAGTPTTQPADAIEKAREVINHQLGPYKVGTGDVLMITLTGLDSAATGSQIQARVDRNGEVRLPVVGKIKVTGMELEDIEEAVRQAYTPQVYRDAMIYVNLAEAGTTKVLVRGAVTTPGFVALRRTDRNLLFAMVGAGGVTELASGLVTLKRIREPRSEVTVDLSTQEGLRSALALAPLENGDCVTVQAATPNAIFVGGLVYAPRTQVYPWGVEMTVLQALAAAGGVRTDVTPREATLIRRIPGDRDVQVKLNLDKITTGKDPNITLAAGDILWVPHTLETRFQDWVNQNLFFRAGVTTTANISYDARALEFMNENAKLNALQYSQNRSSLQDLADPFGFLLQNQAIQQLPTTITNAP